MSTKEQPILATWNIGAAIAISLSFLFIAQSKGGCCLCVTLHADHTNQVNALKAISLYLVVSERSPYI